MFSHLYDAAITFYSHVNYSVTKILSSGISLDQVFYSHVNYSVTKIDGLQNVIMCQFYSHVNYSVTKIHSSTFL